VFVTLLIALLAYAVMPLATRIFGRWLYPEGPGTVNTE